MHILDTIVIGAGQAGLAAGYFLKKEGLDFCILEKHKVGGSWQVYYDNLTLFTPAQYSQLPGLSFPGDPNHYPSRAEMASYLEAYAKHHALPVETGITVSNVRKEDEIFVVATSNGEYRARSVIVAAGPFNEPHTPSIPGMDTFTGKILHTHEYKNPQPFKGKRVVVVGAGASAVQIAVGLAEVGDVTLAQRGKPRFWPRTLFGKDITFWSKYTIDLFNAKPGSSIVIDTKDKQYERALKAGRPKTKTMFTDFYKDGVVWADGTQEHVDAVIFGTGYRPQFSFLPQGKETQMPGLFFLGLQNQRTYASATVRGAVRDGKYIVKKLAQFLKQDTVAVAR